MGMYATAHLYYGVCYGEEIPEWLEGVEDKDWETFLAERAGLKDPYNEPIAQTMPQYSYFADDGAYEQWEREHPDWVARRNQYWDDKQQLVTTAPVEFLYLGHCDLPYYCLALRGSHQQADYDGTPLKSFDVDVLSRQAASQWCAEHGIDWDGPQWMLQSDWG